MSDKTLTTPEAAERLNVSAERVRQLIKAGRLPAQQFGRDYLIREADLALVADRKPGRPKKTDEALSPGETPITRAEMKAGDVVKTPLTSAPARTKAKKATTSAAETKPAKKARD